MEDRKKTLIFFNAAFLNTPSQFFHCHLSPPKFAFYETLSKLKLDWMFAAEGEFYPAQWFSSCSQAERRTFSIFRDNRDDLQDLGTSRNRTYLFPDISLIKLRFHFVY